MRYSCLTGVLLSLSVQQHWHASALIKGNAYITPSPRETSRLLGADGFIQWVRSFTRGRQTGAPAEQNGSPGRDCGSEMSETDET